MLLNFLRGQSLKKPEEGHDYAYLAWQVPTEISAAAPLLLLAKGTIFFDDNFVYVSDFINTFKLFWWLISSSETYKKHTQVQPKVNLHRPFCTWCLPPDSMERAQGPSWHTKKKALLSSSLPPVVPVFAEQIRKQRSCLGTSTGTKTRIELLQPLGQAVHMTFACISLSAEYMMCLFANRRIFCPKINCCSLS